MCCVGEQTELVFFIVRSLYNPTLVNAAYYLFGNWIGKYNISINIVSICLHRVGLH